MVRRTEDEDRRRRIDKKRGKKCGDENDRKMEESGGESVKERRGRRDRKKKRVESGWKKNIKESNKRRGVWVGGRGRGRGEKRRFRGKRKDIIESLEEKMSKLEEGDKKEVIWKEAEEKLKINKAGRERNRKWRKYTREKWKGK